MTNSFTGKPKGKPRGRPFKPGVSPNPKDRPKRDEAARRIEMDARLLAREHGAEAVHKLIEVMRGVVRVTKTVEGEPVEQELIAPPQAQLTAALGLLDRGYGRPPQSLEVCGGDVQADSGDGVIQALESRLVELGERIRAQLLLPKLN